AERIFLPGVTTNQAVTTTSGRGVGMSAVRRRVEELGGRAGVEFTAGAASGYRPFELVLELPEDAAVQPSPLQPRPPFAPVQRAVERAARGCRLHPPQEVAPAPGNV